MNNSRYIMMSLVAGCACIVMLSGCTGVSPNNLRAKAYVPDVRRTAGMWAAVTPLPSGQVLRKGDRITVYLKGIPREEEIQTMINDLGEITLSLVKTVKVEGLTWPEAEKLIQKKYVEGEFYKEVTVIIVGQAGEYYVSGEVLKPGEFMLSGEMHLTQAIMKAGGYTDFANKKKIRVVRGQEKQEYNCEKIEQREADDPLLKTGDQIYVPSDNSPFGSW